MELPIDRSLNKIKILYRIAGVNIHENRKKTLAECARWAFHFIWILTDIVMACHWYIVGAIEGVNFMELTHVMPCFSLGVMAEFKMSFIVYYEKKVHQLLNNLRRLEERKLSHDPVKRDVIQKETQFLAIVINVLVTVNVILLIMFNIGPLILIAVKYYMTGELELSLPFLDVYPFDGYDLRYWPFAYLHEIWTSIIVLIEIFAVDFLFYICCTHIGIQFQLLQREAEELIPDKQVQASWKLREKVGDLVKWHQDVIQSADMLEEIYSKSTLYNYLTSSMVICLTGFNVTTLQNMTIVVTFATIALVGMLQILFLCFFGNMLMDASTDVSLAAHSSKWYHSDVSVRKSILIILTRAQKPCKLTAAGFADVNLKAFMKILSTSWSYFALLQTVYRSEFS